MHCFPDIQQIVDRVSHVRKKVHGLKKLYIMTNGDKVFLHDLKSALHAADHWEQISTSRDLMVTWEQKPIAQALDMYVAQRAQAFIGNGVRVFSPTPILLASCADGHHLMTVLKHDIKHCHVPHGHPIPQPKRHVLLVNNATFKMGVRVLGR